MALFTRRSQRQPSATRVRDRLVAAAAGLAMLAAGVLIGMQKPSGETADVPRQSGDAEADPESAAADEADSLSDHSEQGAVAAAAGYLVTLGGESMLDPATRQQWLEETVLPEARDDVADLVGGIDLVVERLNLSPEVVSDPGFVLRTVPAGYRVVEHSDDRAVVEVWQTSVFAASGRAVPPEATWHTTAFELRWVDGRWLIAGLDGREGPAPSGDEAATGVEGRRIGRFEEFRHVPSG